MQIDNQTGRGVFRCTESVPYEYIDPFQNVIGPLQNVTGPGRRRLLTDGLFDNYLWLGGVN